MKRLRILGTTKTRRREGRKKGGERGDLFTDEQVNATRRKLIWWRQQLGVFGG